jgi:hypothetical protein
MKLFVISQTTQNFSMYFFVKMLFNFNAKQQHQHIVGELGVV